MSDKDISSAVINRLPRYYRYLGDLLDNDVVRISSKELSEKMHVTASQIRQDLNNFGGFGQQGYGYNVEYLYNEIAKIRGLDRKYDMVIIGAGNIGQAIAGYTDFEKRGFTRDNQNGKDENTTSDDSETTEKNSITTNSAMTVRASKTRLQPLLPSLR